MLCSVYQPAVWLANLSSDWADCFCLVSSRPRFSPSFLRFLIATSSWSAVSCLLSLHPWPMGCGNSGHFLHAATTAVVHKHSVKRISDRILNDCNTDSFKSQTKLSTKLSFMLNISLKSNNKENTLHRSAAAAHYPGNHQNGS